MKVTYMTYSQASPSSSRPREHSLETVVQHGGGRIANPSLFTDVIRANKINRSMSSHPASRPASVAGPARQHPPCNRARCYLRFCQIPIAFISVALLQKSVLCLSRSRSSPLTEKDGEQSGDWNWNAWHLQLRGRLLQWDWDVLHLFLRLSRKGEGCK